MLLLNANYVVMYLKFVSAAKLNKIGNNHKNVPTNALMLPWAINKTLFRATKHWLNRSIFPQIGQKCYVFAAIFKRTLCIKN